MKMKKVSDLFSGRAIAIVTENLRVQEVLSGYDDSFWMAFKSYYPNYLKLKWIKSVLCVYSSDDDQYLGVFNKGKN